MHLLCGVAWLWWGWETYISECLNSTASCLVTNTSACHGGLARWRKLCSFSKNSVTSPTSQLILQTFRRFTYVTANSPTLPLLHLHRSSLSNASVVSPASQLILQTFFLFSFVTGSSLTSPGEPPMPHAQIFQTTIPLSLQGFVDSNAVCQQMTLLDIHLCYRKILRFWVWPLLFFFIKYKG